MNYANVITQLAANKWSRQAIINMADKELKKNLIGNKTDATKIDEMKYFWASAFLRQAKRSLDKNLVSKEMLSRISQTLVHGAFHEDKDFHKRCEEQYKDRYGVEPPTFLVISPTQRCNLKCTGCYACSDSHTSPTLDWNTLTDLVHQFHEEAGGKFIVVSGGEPLMYRSDGKSILDLFEMFPDIFFMFYTNGTLIDKNLAHRLSLLGNGIPAISVEGYEKETDERRGKGTYSKILAAAENLKEVGVPFATSVTATAKNANLLLDDAFYTYYFEEVGCSYMWQFQLMPIGRGKEIFNLMPDPQTRVQLYRKWEHVIRDLKYPFADFWNSGVLTNGCIAYGRKGGYVYIDWNGNIMPCVFVPYHVDNIYKLKEKGLKFGHALGSEFMQNGRKWHFNYQDHKSPRNLLCPCSIRDHYENFRQNILVREAKGSDDIAQEILNDEEYFKELTSYDRNLEQITEKIWQTEYSHR